MVLLDKKWKPRMLPTPDSRRQNRWFFGGVSSTLAVVVTHPLDLLKVLLQTQETRGSLLQSINTVYQRNGFWGFYNGISASLARQMTSTTARFGVYEMLRQDIKTDTFLKKTCVASIAGLIGSIVGVPLDAVNVRMQNDMKLPPAERRNYQHVGHGLLITYRDGGVPALFAGCIPAMLRGMVLTICPIAVYDYIKNTLKENYFHKDDIKLHLTSSLIASCVATGLTQPIDVWKTRIMCSPHSNGPQILKQIYKEGPLAFYKGTIPSFMRLGPHSVLLIVLMEQLRLRWGEFPSNETMQEITSMKKN